jgi:phosphatidylglycerol:prolipoprotein diacylglycerol transferase
VHMSGRLRSTPPAGRPESFAVTGTVARIVPGSGRVALTIRVPELTAGTWDVTATLMRPAPARSPAP